MTFKVRVSHPRFVPDLVDALRRADCLARKTKKDEIEIEVPQAPSREQARRELELYLASWLARHPEARADLVG